MCKPGNVQINGHAIDLGSLDMPAYIYASREDHIVPWQAAYASCGLLSGPRRFVMGASGHIAGVINPPAKNRRSYWAAPGELSAGEPSQPAEAWQAVASETPGSWWPDWAAWLAQHGGAQRKAPAKPGNVRHKALEDAPGSYVKARAV